jgi:hypothetical protein
MATKLTPTEARQGLRAMFWVLTVSITWSQDFCSDLAGSPFPDAAPLDREAAKTNLLVKGSF